MKQAASVHLIELKLQDVQQLFNSMDPSPFHDRDLDQDAEDFIVSWARESPAGAALRIVIHLERPAPEFADVSTAVSGSIRHYFAYRAEVTRRELRRLFRQGRVSLVIGLAFLVACQVGAAAVFGSEWEAGHGIAREGLAILGWVAMWHPLDLLLYRWWPVRQDIRLYERLAGASIVIESTA